MHSKDTKRPPVELVDAARFSKVGPHLPTPPSGSVQYSPRTGKVSIPKEWAQALKKEGIPIAAFLNQAVVSDGDWDKLREIKKRVDLLCDNVVRRMELDPALYREVRPRLEISREFEKKGSLPKKPPHPLSRDAQLKLSGMIVDALRFESSGFLSEKSFFATGLNDSPDMHENSARSGNCLVVSLYYLCVAERFGLRVDVYAVAKHAFVGLRLGKEVVFADPLFGLERVSPGIKQFEGGTVVDYRRPRKVECHGLVGSWHNKGCLLWEKGVCERYNKDFTGALKTFHESVDAFRSALAIDPSYPYSLYYMGSALAYAGDCYFELSKLGEARKKWLEAVRFSEFALIAEPAYADPCGAKAYALFRLGTCGDSHERSRMWLGAALKSIDTALRKEPNLKFRSLKDRILASIRDLGARQN